MNIKTFTTLNFAELNTTDAANFNIIDIEILKIITIKKFLGIDIICELLHRKTICLAISKRPTAESIRSKSRCDNWSIFRWIIQLKKSSWLEIRIRVHQTYTIYNITCTGTSRPINRELNSDFKSKFSFNFRDINYGSHWLTSFHCWGPRR